MIFVDPKTGKEYKNVIDAARATLCPGPCIDCPLRDMSSRGESYQVNAEKCALWAYDHPVAFAERMGLAIKDSLREDMTLGEVKELCIKRHGEFHSEACVACVMYNPEIGDCALGTRHMAPMDWELYTGLQFSDYTERKRLNGLYEVYSTKVTIRRYSRSDLVLILPDGKAYPLPPEWLDKLPAGAEFSLDEARKNKWMFVGLCYFTQPNKAPERQPSFGPTNGQPCQPCQIQQDEQEA